MRLLTFFILASFATVAVSSTKAPAETTPAPGALSELMTRLQLQHAKLWFAGKLSNWGLASDEIQQIDRNLETAGNLLSDRSRLAVTKDRLQAVNEAILQKDGPAFTKAYSALTNDCNGCHRTSGFASITIEVPVRPPVSNQLFVDQLTEGRALAHASCGTCHVVDDAARQTPASRPAAPSFLEIANRPSFSADDLRQFLASSHRRLGPDQAMPNPRLADYQIEAIVAYLETLKAASGR
ncbi:cytochrome c [Bradyrhizobium sp. INPA01-394B]|uniref:Cytochrome c n=1 Tax=Bradyrhizobium campsiandrae TaxID=1729892 RepID=A0ABR7U7I4_9BRAD|nr:cytochrome c [Bradyrhizobium campsiandrae]MBC9881150.1 cytochrome c [Bradyrhizobium campsiandrae]MBC9980004.1 cytochrome c [Bradyrhizobium campsiandrae]